jgi:uncharacterized protein YjiS (DUF1127 family)
MPTKDSGMLCIMPGEKKEEERRRSIAEAWRRICHYHSSSTVRTCILQMGQHEIVSIGILLQLKNNGEKASGTEVGAKY